MTDEGPTIEQTHRNVLTVRFDNVGPGWEQWILLSSDRHHDNRLTDWSLERKHLKLADERNAYILDCGDFFCAMQGKYDRRSDMSQVRQEHNVNNYLDALVDTAADFFAPYARRFLMIGKGNHESSVEDRHGTNLVSNLIHRLNNDHGGNIVYGYYAGWVRFMFRIRNMRLSKKLYYHHGAGGGGPVTRGVIQTNRQSVYLPDADVVFNGHTHDSWVVPIARHRLGNKGTTYQDVCYHVRTPGYKRDFSDGAEGFHVERWGPPKPVGCIWMRMFHDSKDGIRIEMIQDIE